MSGAPLPSGSAEQLRAYVSRIERIEGEISELNQGKKETYAEARAYGLDKRALQKVIQRRRRGTEDSREEDAVVELYEDVLSGRGALERRMRRDRYGPAVENARNRGEDIGGETDPLDL